VIPNNQCKNILWPFYKQPPSLTKLPSFTVRDFKKDNTFMSISHNLADTTAKQEPKQTLPQAILPIHYNYTQKKEEIKTQEASQHQGYWFLNNIPLFYWNNKLNPY
jgi:hypothetical protein